MKQPLREEVIWAAGFFDGEGHARSHKNYSRSGKYEKYIGVKLSIKQTDRRVLDRFQKAIMGFGYIHSQKWDGILTHKPLWYWQAGSFEQTQAVIAMLYQFLSPVKQEQCLNALKEC